jgi:seryl-tRNA synthetase
MLELERIRRNPKEVIHGLESRGVTNAEELIGKLLSLVEERSAFRTQLEQFRKQQNEMAKQIGILFQQGKREEAEQLKAESVHLKTQIDEWEEKTKQVEEKIQSILLQLPNLPHESVPYGRNSEDNVVVKAFKGVIYENPSRKFHWDIAQEKGWIDFRAGAKVSGSGFPFYIGPMTKLQRALIQFFLDQATQAGYQEIQPPLLVNEATGFGTGQLPDKDGQMYFIAQDRLYLIPTAEVPLTNLVRDEILDEADLPLKFCGYTPCFRREAGSYGKEVRGLNRLHQFDKVEIVQITTPESSYQALEEMVEYVASLLQKLEMRFRIVSLCRGDLGFTSAKTYDMEVYSAVQEKWLEVSSISNFETFQSTRLRVRFKRGNQKVLPHTLNGSALALPRLIAAMLENFQLPDNRIALPKVLHPYFGNAYLE